MPSGVGAVVVAAGRSTRLGHDKLFVGVAGAEVLAWALRAFEESSEVGEIALVLNASNADRGRALVAAAGFSKVRHFCIGGARRQDSVRAGLAALAGCEWVAIHDGARPLVTPDLIARGLAAARATGAAIPGVPLKDTVKVVRPDGTAELVAATPDRSALRAIQTPQVFRYELIVDAYRRAPGEVTDDAALLEVLGHPVVVYPGAYDNLKITTADDLVVAEALLLRRERPAGAG